MTKTPHPEAELVPLKREREEKKREEGRGEHAVVHRSNTHFVTE